MKKKTLVLILVVGVILATSIIIVLAMKGRNSVSLVGVSEKEKYSKFEAEFICQFIKKSGVQQENIDLNMTGVTADMEILAKKYGYTDEQTLELKNKYENNSEVKQLAIEEMRKICPDEIAKLEAMGEISW